MRSLAFVLVPCVLGQEPGRPPVAEQLATLRVQLADADIPTTRREKLLRTFLEERGRELGREQQQALGVQLATLELVNRKPLAAMRRLQEIERGCAPDQIDVRARCRLLMAQASELLGDSGEAMRRYEEVSRTFPGTREARIAGLARDRLRLRGELRLGLRVPLPNDLRTVDGNPLPARTGTQPRLLLFLPATTMALPESLREILAARLDLPIIALVSGSDPAAREWSRSLAGTEAATRGELHIVPRPAARQDPILRDLGLTALPLWLLLDRQGRIADVNPPLRGVR